MSFSAGVFSINTAGQPVVSGTTISSVAFNALTADLASGLSNCILKDGTQTATARVAFIFGVSSTLTTDSTSISTGSLLTSGGAGITKALWVGGLANIAGAVTLQGGLTVSAGGLSLEGGISGNTVAVQADMEGASATNVIVTPGRQQFHPGMAKMWASIAPVGGTGPATVNASYNLTSATDGGTGIFTFTIANDFASASYAVLATAHLSSNALICVVESYAAGSFEVRVYDAAGTLADPTTLYVAAFGDQA